MPGTGPGSGCPEPVLEPCTPSSQGCSSDPNADKDHDGYYVQTPNCTPDPTLIDCNDDVATIHPGQMETSCFENPAIDEDCDGPKNCEDSDCRTVHGSACDGQCDKDGDQHYSNACAGDDCVDDPALNAAAGFIYPGLNNNSGEPQYEWNCANDSPSDEDCDGLLNCADPDCAEASNCAPTPTPTPLGGGGEPQPGPTYCYGVYSGTDYYVYDWKLRAWNYAFTVWEYSTYCYSLLLQ